MSLHLLKEKVVGDIAESGWSGIGVGADPDDDESVPFTYSIGLAERYGHPELVVTGLVPTIGHGLIEAAVQRYVEASAPKRQPLEPGRQYEEIIEHYQAEIRPVSMDRRNECLCWAAWYHREIRRIDDDSWGALQIVWPDPEGLYPWDDDYAEEFIQPLLAV